MWLRYLLVFYGLVNMGGGIFAYLSPKSHSLKSLLVGCVAGLLLVLCGVFAKSKPALSFRSSGIIVFGLGVFWIYRTVSLMQASKSIAMSAGNLLLAAVVMALLLYGHFSAIDRRKKMRAAKANKTTPEAD